MDNIYDLLLNSPDEIGNCLNIQSGVDNCGLACFAGSFAARVARLTFGWLRLGAKGIHADNYDRLAFLKPVMNSLLTLW